MKALSFPLLKPDDISVTRHALHAYAEILGGWTSTCRARRKHWWHASLRPTTNGVTTGVIYTDNTLFEIELNFKRSELVAHVSSDKALDIKLRGQPAAEIAEQVRGYLLSSGVADELTNTASAKSRDRNDEFPSYSPEQANKLAESLNVVSEALETFRAGIREETSPIQLWPHHFDLSMLWLPGDKIADQDPADEENADKQLNFGFTFGDEVIPEPYFYVTAYPSPDALSNLDLPEGTVWRSDGFTGGVVTYRRLLEESAPRAYLLHLWTILLDEGKRLMINSP